MLQTLYMQHQTVWFWGPRAGWRKASVISSSGHTVKVCEYINDDHYRTHRLTPYRIFPRSRGINPKDKTHGTLWLHDSCPQTTNSIRSTG